MKHARPALVAILLICAWHTFARAAAQALPFAIETKDTDPAVHALCGKRIALLGESPLHGFGETLAFKAALVRRLVTECHYNALLIESGTYDYLHIERVRSSGEPVTDAMVTAAIGGLWANREVQSLVPFLTENVRAGTLTLGGLDDQIGRGSYASLHMADDLVETLQTEEKPRCLAILRKHLLWQYTGDAPYSQSDKTKIEACLDHIQTSLASAGKQNQPWAQGKAAMIGSLKRNLARDFTEDDFTKSDQQVRWDNDRDRSMYLNFQSLLSQLPRHSKVIVWAATVHTAIDLSRINGFAGRVPLGSYIRHDFGKRAFVLGFSAYSGRYAMGHHPVQSLGTAPVASLEARAVAEVDGETIYLSRHRLSGYGNIEARPLGISFKAAHWDHVLDGLVVFREERPPDYLAR